MLLDINKEIRELRNFLELVKEVKEIYGVSAKSAHEFINDFVEDRLEVKERLSDIERCECYKYNFNIDIKEEKPSKEEIISTFLKNLEKLNSE